MATFFEVTIFGQQTGGAVINRMTFASTIDGVNIADAPLLLEALGFNPTQVEDPISEKFFGQWLEASSTSYRINEILVRNLYSVIDFIVQPVSGAGWAGTIGSLNGGADLPPFVCAKLQTNRVRSDIRRGTLSMPMVRESQQTSAGLWEPGYLTLLASVANALNAVTSETPGGTNTYRPAIFSKQRYETDPGGPGKSPKYAYRYWETESEQAQHAALGVEWGVKGSATSQNTRKTNRGI